MYETLSLLVVYVCGAGLFLVLGHRFIRQLSGWAATILLLLPLVSTGSAMFSGGFYGALNLSYNTAPLHADATRLEPPEEGFRNGTLADQIYQVVPWRKAIRELVKTGHAPLINRFSRAGDPLLGASQPAPFDPKVWLGFLLPLSTAMTFACSLVLFQAALFTFLFLRDLDVDELGALFGAAVWMTCGFLDFYVTWSMASVVVACPLLLLGLRRLARGEPQGESYGAPIALCAWLLALAGGHPESVLHVTTLGGVVFLWELRWSPDPRRAIVKAVVTGLLALSLAAPILLPFAEVLPQTVDYQMRRSQHPQPSLPWAEVAASSLGALYPQGWGEPWAGDREGLPSRFNAAGGAFVGGLALAFAGLGLRYGPRERFLFGALAVLTFLVAMGAPGFLDAVVALPLYHLALNSRLVSITSFALAVLAAFGFDAARRDPSRGRMAFLLAVGLAIGIGSFVHLDGMLEKGLDVDGHQKDLVWLFVPVVAALFGLLSRSPRVLAGLWLGLFLISHRAELPRFYHAFDSSLFYPQVPELATLPHDGEPYRVVGRTFDLVPGQAALWELEDIRGPAVLTNRRFAQLSPAWCKPMYAWYCRVDSVDPPLLDLFNVRYALTDPNGPPARDWPLLVRGENLAIYENPNVLPRAFVPTQISFVKPGTSVVAELTAATDFRAMAFIEDAESPPGPPRPTPNGEAVVTTTAAGPDLHFKVEAREASWVVVSQTFWSGWQAVDEAGRSLDLYRADHAFLAFQVPPGHSAIRLLYRPRGWLLGWLVCGMTLLVLAALAAYRWARIRGRQALAGEGVS